MKRLVALLALAVAACAEAVTLSWSATDITSATYRQVSATQDFAIVITYATPDPPKGDWRTLLSIGAYKDGAYIGGDRQDLFRIQEANDGGSRRYFVYGNLNSDTNASASLAVSNDPQRFIVNKKGDTFTVYIGGKQLPEEKDGWFEIPSNATGDFTLDGYLELTQGDGNILRREFSQKYTVVEPSATVSATLMNVLYAGYDNPISVSVPGVPPGQVQATMSNGTLTRSGAGYVARPEVIGQDAVIHVTATVNGRTQSMGDYAYRVRALPDPSPFIEYTDQGTPKRYRGGTGLPKAVLMNTPGIVAAIDDGLLNIDFRVLSFETVFYDNMGNAVPEVSAGASFSQRQKDMFRRLSRGKRFYISRVRAIGPDGVERLLPTTLEVIVN